MIEAPHACGCCREPIKGKPFHSCGVGLVCRECGDGIRTAIQILGRAGLRGLYLGNCPDNRKGGLK